MTLAWLAAAWIAGTVAAATLGRGAWELAFAVALAATAVAAVRRDRRTLLLALALPLLFLASAARYETSRPHLSPDAAARFNDSVAMRIRAVLRDDPDLGDASQRFAVTVRAVQLRGEWQPASGGVLVTTGLFPRYRSGDVLELEGQLQSPAAVPGFDYAEYLSRRGIASTMAFPAAHLVGHEDDSIVRATVLSLRRRLSRGIDLALPEPQSSLARSVLLGRRSALPPDLAADLNTTNTSHLVVVSGSNVVLVSAFATMFVMWAVGRRRALLLSIAAIAAYAALIGFSPPVLRALIMGVLMVIATVSGRRASSITALAFAAALMLGLDPSAIRDVSFQLSFAATAGILYLASPLRRWIIALAARALRRDAVPGWLPTLVVEPLAVTLAAIAATAPLLALNFGRLSLVAVPANLLVVPAFPLILGSSLVAAVGGLLPAGRLIFAAPAYYLLSFWIETTRWFAALPHAALEVGAFTGWWALAAYAALALAAAALLSLRPPEAPSIAQWSPRLPGLLAVAMPALLLAVAVGWWSRPSPPARLRVTVLDVGQGDAILIQSPSGRQVLIDGGPGAAVLRALGDELPWYDRSIDLVLLTHPQADHMYGLVDVLARYDVGRVLAGPGVQPSAGDRAWLAAVGAEHLNVEPARRGTTLDLGGGARLDVIGPDDAMAADPQVNNTGSVVRLSYGGVSFLFAADIEAKAERALLNAAVDVGANVLKVAHHGSNTSSTAEFLAAVRPAVAVVSSGKDNQFGHPAAEVVARLQRYATVYNTASAGSVRFETDGQRLWVAPSH
ncbi:MAG TPA: DNA internalization-related competence protein ComEC/Rec2 [Dehalococcoidia bacterium]|nr:DNA internalization-related competence protein ComEC/Rec2 [Dehalococcoidia bacterium]